MLDLVHNGTLYCISSLEILISQASVAYFSLCHMLNLKNSPVEYNVTILSIPRWHTAWADITSQFSIIKYKEGNIHFNRHRTDFVL